jgi:putative N6-adenine-specific DNA methylase
MSDPRLPCFATASFGLEALVRAELEALGVGIDRVEDRRVLFTAAPADIARCNIGLRTADRVLLRVAELDAPDFDALYEGVRAVPWRDMLGRDPSVTVNARSAKSRLASVPAVQSVAKKAIVDAIVGRKGGASQARLPETGPRCDVEVALNGDRATVCLDTTGPGLHKRGWRRETGEAPLRENLAAALVLLSRWDSSRPFLDPLCGAGTIPIEAALIAANAAPGIGRSFAAEGWPLFPKPIWQEAREKARAAIRRDVEVRIDASDRSPAMTEAGERNAQKAGVRELIRFRTAALESLRPEGEHGCIVCNPPYGERLGSAAEADALYRAMGTLFRSLPTWSLFALSASEDFQRSFGARASRNRKLYNGSIRCWYYQYFGPLRSR